MIKKKFSAANSRELPQLGAASRTVLKIRANSRNPWLRFWTFPLKTVEPNKVNCPQDGCCGAM
jgi:hypothetical protein